METKDPRTRDAPDTGPDTGFGRLVAVDFESFYDTKQGYSLSKMTAYDYIHDHRFDPYLVAVVGETGKEYVGNPLDFDWMQLDGCELVMHNAAFDGLIVLHLIETGQIPDFKRTLSDTADMCAFMGLPRALDKACGYLLGISVSKARRAAMDGVRFQDLGEEARAGMIDYAADDSRLCLRLYQKYADKWPWWEQEISRLNRECTVWGGIHIDRAAAVAGLERLRKRKADAEATIPWNDGERKTGSCKHFIAYLRDAGLPVPSSLNKQDPGFAAWLKTYGSDPVVAARLDVASLGSHIKRLEAVLLRGDDDDILRVDSMFYGAHTGRCSGGADRDNDDSGGGAKFNIYNLPKGDDEGFIHGVDMRGILTPRPGHAFVIFDFGQIEARVVQWLAGNKAFLERAARENIYQAVAKTLGWYPEDGSDLKGHDRKLYALAKEAGLGLGFGMGAAKFLLRCEKSGIALDPVPKDRWVLDRRNKFILRNVAQKPWTDPANEEWISRFFAADNIVQAWRARNPQVVALWRALEDSLAAAADRQEAVHYYTLPSGRRKPYWKPRRTAVPKIVLDPDSGEASQVVESRLTAFLVRDSKQMYKTLHGGPITENVVQATARDVMFFGAIAVGRESPKRADGTAAWKYLWNCYDELIFEVPLSDADDACKVIPRCLTDTDTDISGWAKGLPLEVEGGVAERYKKSDPRWFKYPVRA